MIITYLNALNMSKNTKQVNVIVVSRAVIFPSSKVILKTHVVPQMMMKALRRMLNIRLRVKICSLTFLGGFFNTSGSTGSRPKLCAKIYIKKGTRISVSTRKLQYTFFLKKKKSSESILDHVCC